MFEKAARLKLRFPFRGMLTVEDLWDLKLEDLDTIFKGHNLKLKEVGEESLLGTKSKEDEILALQISIVKYIVNVRLLEQKERTSEKERSEYKQKILSIVAEKQDAGLKDMSIEDLLKLVE